MTKPRSIPSGEDIFGLMGTHILITGNPVDGFEHYGPFKLPFNHTEGATP